MLNVVALMGRLVADPELRHTPNGIATCTFRIACDRSYAKAGEERKADFLDIVVWRQTAEFVCKYFHKGSLIALDGSIQTRNYEDKNGNKRTAFEIAASNVHFADSKGSGGNGGYAASTAPAEYSRASAAQPASYASGTVDDFAVLDDNEDLPF
ncbi:MAG: single-stranded DNA-binding protein [Oscillospiraceae bacterium]|nr:single-stranded DNA-binding protein [Oscillospiraceae bacterium]